jgi:chromosome segregation ATPase
MEKIKGMKNFATNSSEEAAHLATKLHSSNTELQECQVESKKKEEHLTQLVNESRKECSRLKVRMEGLQGSLTHVEGIKKSVENQLSAEKRRFDEERGVFAEKLRSSIEASKDAHMLKAQVKELSLFREQQGLERQNWTDMKAEFSRQMNDIQDNLSGAKQREIELLSDREASVKALQQTIEATKELSTRYNDEKVRRMACEDRLKAAEERVSAAEKIAESVSRAKEHVSSAVLDALQKEKQRSSDLQKQLHGEHPIRIAAAAAASGAPSTVDPFEAFPPPAPAPTQAQARQPPNKAALNSSVTSSFSASTSTSTGSDAKAELARLRAELHQMEGNQP